MAFVFGEKTERRIELLRDPRLKQFAYFAFTLGAGLIAAGGGYYVLRADAAYALLAVGLGAVLFFSGRMLLIQADSLPRALIFDGDGGRVEIRESGGASVSFGFREIDRVALRYAGRGRFIAVLLRNNGASFDLFSVYGRKRAEVRAAELARLLDQAHSRDHAPPLSSAALERLALPDGGWVYTWQDSISTPALWNAVGLVAGGSLIAWSIGWLYGHPEPGAILAGVFFLGGCLIALWGLLHARRTRPFIAVTGTRITHGRAPLERMAELAPLAHRYRLLDEIVALELIFDAAAGVQRLLALKQSEYERQRKGRALLSAGITAWRASLVGLRVSDGLALEYALRDALKSQGRKVR